MRNREISNIINLNFVPFSDNLYKNYFIIQNLLMLEETKYCYWDVHSERDIQIMIWNCCFAFLLILLTFVCYCKSMKHLNPSHISWVYFLLLAWGLSFESQYIFSIVVERTRKKEEIERDITKYSQYYQLLDFLTAYILIGTLLFISKQRISKIFYSLNQADIKITKPERRGFLFLKRYMQFRLFYLIPTITMFFLPSSRSELVSLFSNIELSFFFLDLLLCNIVLLITSLKTLEKLKLLNFEDKEMRQLKIENYILQALGFSRFIMDLFFLVFNSKKCDENIAFKTWVYLFLGQIINYFIPVLFILKIHYFSESEQIKKESLKMSENLLNHE